MLLGVCGSACADPYEDLSFGRLSDFSLCALWTHLSRHAATPLEFFPCSYSPLHTRLSREAERLSSDLNLDREKRTLENCPMLMLLTTLCFLEGLCKTCFSTVMFFPEPGGVTTSLSAGWLRVMAHSLSSTGKSVVITPLMW